MKNRAIIKQEEYSSINNEYVNGMVLENQAKFNISETRARFAEFADPLTVNFKLMVNFNRTDGLFADELNKNSALAYLKRIGENTRYELLKNWIENFKTLLTDYDFLLLNADGLDIITNAKAWEAFTANDKLKFTFRDTSDMFVQSIFTMYRHIWFDNNRGVEVLPVNLRMFDIGVLVYNSAYFNTNFYDDAEFIANQNLGQVINYSKNTKNINRFIFPTIQKLSKGYFQEMSNETYNFNHIMIFADRCEINTEDTNRTIFTSISNEPNSDMVKSELTLNFRFGSYTGIFHNIFGSFDPLAEFAKEAASQKYNNTQKYSGILSDTTDVDEILRQLEIQKEQETKSFFDNLKNTGKNIVNDIVSSTTAEYNKLSPKNLLNKAKTIGNIYQDSITRNITEQATNILSTPAKLAQNLLNDFAIQPLNKVLSFASYYSPNFINKINEEYQKNISNRVSELIDTSSNYNEVKVEEDKFDTTPASKNITEIPKGTNIYSRRNF